MFLSKKDILLVLAFALSIFLVSAATHGSGSALDYLNMILASSFILLVVLITYRRISLRLNRMERSLRKKLANDYNQVEALFSIFASVQPKYPLPATRDWSASPDFLKEVVKNVYETRPDFVLEASSGTSTLIIAHCLSRIGHGKVVSLEHDEHFANATKRLISAHGLEDVADVIYAPLKKYDLNGESWLWYETSALQPPSLIDMFVIDGPPKDTQRLARYPALPLLFDRIRENAVILMDDGARDDETQIVKRWAEELPLGSKTYLSLEKGAFLLKK